jgi:cell division septation protein DedD
MACDLDLTERGTARVRVDALEGPGGTPPPAHALKGPFAWQVGAFTAPDGAQTVAETLRRQYGEVTVEPYQRGDRSFHRVRVGSYPTASAALAERRSIEALGFTPFLVRRD